MDQHQISALLDPACYPEPTGSVEFKQTHISWIFFTDRLVYKFKKPVDFGFLDFTTLEKRRFYCQEELRLNRRLSPDIYLGIAELRQASDGLLTVDGIGETIDYGVKMVRLPEDRMMARLLEQGAVTPDDISRLARLVAVFHAAAVNSPAIDRFGTPEAIRANWQENLQQTALYAGRTISAGALEQIGDWALERLERDERLFRQRVSGGFIRECDGDLHSENICLDDRIHIFDCIEFNEKFRYSDTAADIAFLAMDLENHGRRDLAAQFVAEYIEFSNDRGLRGVLTLYLANRAFIRGKVESFRLDDPGIPPAEKLAAKARAARFFRLARGYALRERLPRTLFLTCAPTGAGKSALAAELAFQLGMDHLASDAVRKKLAGIPANARGADIYTAEWNRKTYGELARLAGERLARGESVLVDATFIRRSDRQRFADLASLAGFRLVILQLICPPEVVRQRLQLRGMDPQSVSDGTWEVYQRQAGALEEPDPAEGLVVRLDAALAPEVLVEEVLLQL